MTMPALFDERANFMPLSESEYMELSETEQRLYDGVHEGFNDLLATEKALRLADGAVTETAAEIREIEHTLSKLPKKSHVDIAREWIASQRQHG